MKKYFSKSVIIVLLFSWHVSVFAQLPPVHAGETDGYHLVWQDLFNEGTVNTSIWNIANDGSGGGNQEMEYYIPNNVSVGIEPVSGESCLILTAKLENYSGHVCTSGKVKSQGKMSFQYGKMEARIKLPKTGNGLWPAFWMMGNTGSWPSCGEIDVLEMGATKGINSGTQERYFNGALHYGQSSDKGGGQSSTWPYSLQDEDFHLFTLVWMPNMIHMYVDIDKYPDEYPNNIPYYYLPTPPNSDVNAPANFFNKQPFYVIFNLAIGGTFTGITDNNNIGQITAFQKASDGEPKMYVDYVKVYQLGNPEDVYNGPALAGIEVPVSEQVKIAQDPVTGDIQVINAPEAPKSITIYDITGQKTLEVYQTGVVSTSSLSKGIYVLRIELSTGELKSYKFIKK